MPLECLRKKWQLLNAFLLLQIEFPEGQAFATITLTVRDDDIAELQETTYIQLTQVVQSGTTLPGRGAYIGKSTWHH